MEWGVFLYTFVMTATSIFMFVSAWYVWHRHREPTTRAMVALLLALAVWLFTNALEAASMRVPTMLLWSKLQFIGMAGVPTLWLVFVSRFTGYDNWLVLWVKVLLGAFCLAVAVLGLSNDLHGLMWSSAVPADNLISLSKTWGPAFWVFAAHSYAAFIVASLFLLVTLFRSPRLYRRQIIVLLMVEALPAIGAGLYMFGPPAFSQVDLMALSFAASGPVIAWGLYRLRVGDILPVAREQVIESIADGIIVLDAHDQIIDMNTAAQEIIGCPLSEAIEQSLKDVWPLWLQTTATREQNDEIVINRDEGSFTYTISLFPLEDRSGRLVSQVVTLHDVTVLKKQMAELGAANQRLLELSRTKDEFIANVSHELRTPITSIKLYQHLLTTRPEKQDAYLETLQRETSRLETIVEDLLLVSILDRAELPLDFAPLNINELVRGYITDRRLLAEHAELTLTFDWDDDVPMVNADEAALGKVLSVLLTNALNYTPAGGRVTVRVHACESGGTQWVGFSVADTGPGIPPEERVLLFQRFVRGQTGRASGRPGTGLGLAIAKEIVEQHHGRIEVTSVDAPGGGATFTVWLPVDEG